eukprot:gene16659-19797_t
MELPIIVRARADQPCRHVVGDDGAIDTGSRCEPYYGRQECQGRLKNPSSIYVPTNKTQEDLFGLIKDRWILAPLLEGCGNNHTFKLLCNGAFKECINVTTNGSYHGKTSIGVFVNQCFKDCKIGQVDCLKPADSCSPTYPNSSAVEYPAVSNTFDLSSYGGPSAYVVPCLDLDTIQSNSSFTHVCPDPLIYRSPGTANRKDEFKKGYRYIGDTDCVMPCPSPSFSKKEYDVLFGMVYGMTVIGFVCTVFNMFTYGILNRTYDRHSIIIIFLSFSLWLITVTDIVFIKNGFDLLCPEVGRSAVQSDTTCGITGAVFQFAIISSLMWWFALTVDLFLLVKKINPPKKYHKYCIMVIYFIIFTCTIIPAIGRQYGYQYNLKPFIIVTILCVQFIYLFSYHVYLQINSPRFLESFQEYIVCIFTQTDKSECKADTGKLSAQFIYLFIIRLLAIEILIFYGCNRRSKKIWLRSFIFNNRFISGRSKSSHSLSNTNHTKDQSSGIEMTRTPSSTTKQVESSISSDVMTSDDENYNNVVSYTIDTTAPDTITATASSNIPSTTAADE